MDRYKTIMTADSYFLPTYNIDIMLCPVESGISKKDSLSIKAFSLNNIIMMHTICCAPEKNNIYWKYLQDCKSCDVSKVEKWKSK